MTEKGYAPGSDFSPALFATAARGTEGAVRDELRELGFRSVRADRGGVHFGGGLDEGARACIELRTAIRVLYRLAEIEAPDAAALYEGVRGIDWSPSITARQTLAVRAASRDSALTHTQFVAQKTKDAVVDQLRDRSGARPSVDTADPDVLLFIHVVKDRATVYLDMSGASLHRRGWRARAKEAPIKESLAAAILRLSGWDREQPLVDPMCGAGTIPIEAALWSRRIAPGLARERLGFERWASHDAAAARVARDLREAARAKILPEGPPIWGGDIDAEAIGIAEENAQEAGVRVGFRRRSVRDLGPLSPPAQIVVNPPYGERLSASERLYAEMAQAFGLLRGHRIAILAGSPAVVRPMRVRSASSLIVHNGDIECRLINYVVPG